MRIWTEADQGERRPQAQNRMKAQEKRQSKRAQAPPARLSAAWQAPSKIEGTRTIARAYQAQAPADVSG